MKPGSRAVGQSGNRAIGNGNDYTRASELLEYNTHFMRVLFT
jgi:hypothetical protein